MKDDNKNAPIIIVKKSKKRKAEDHGGSWKIAYADFVTAMMAFFMLMWLLSLMNKYQLNGIAEYFKKPLVGAHLQKTNSADKKNMLPGETSLPRWTDGAKKTPQGPMENPLDAFEKKFAAAGEMQEMKKKFEESLEKDKDVQSMQDQVEFEVGDDGLKVSLKELENKPMFPLGKADLSQRAKSLIKWLSKELNTTNNRVMIIGHTDSNEYRGSKDYTNWELSADRANALRKMLVEHGMDPNKVIRVQGAAFTNLLDKNDGTAPKNRRIEVIILNEDTTKKLLNE